MSQRQSAVVTGGSSGIGLACAELLVKSGYDVAIVARNPERLKSALERLESLRVAGDQRVASRSADLSDLASARAALDELHAEGFTPDVLVNSAGVIYPGEFESMPFDHFEANMTNGFWSVVNPCRASVGRMTERGTGHIINVSSVAGYLGIYGYTGYSAAKYAVMGFTESLRCELRPAGVAVSVVCPPDTDTPALAFEHTLRPKETHVIAGAIKPIPAEQVAAAVMRAIHKRRYLVIPDALSAFYFRLKGIWPELFYSIVDGDVKKARRGER